MNTEMGLMNPLLERAKVYTKISVEILKLKSLEKAAETSALLISSLLLAIPIILCAFSVTIGIALWLGNLLGKNYYGFFVVALCYSLIGIILFFTQNGIKLRINNLIIKQIFN